jgi:hypothetical protein
MCDPSAGLESTGQRPVGTCTNECQGEHPYGDNMEWLPYGGLVHYLPNGSVQDVRVQGQEYGHGETAERQRNRRHADGHPKHSHGWMVLREPVR